MDERESFVTYRGWWEAVKELPDDLRLKVYDAINAYAFEDGLSEDVVVNAITALMRTAIDRDKDKYARVCERNRNNGNKGGRPRNEVETELEISEEAETQKKPKNPKNPKNPVGYLGYSEKPKETQIPHYDYEYDYDIYKEKSTDVDKKKATSTKKSVQKVSVNGEIELMQSDAIWIEATAKNTGVDPSKIPKYLAAFAERCLCDGLSSHTDIADAKRHFNSWLRKYLQLEKHETDKDDKLRRRRGTDPNTADPTAFSETL